MLYENINWTKLEELNIEQSWGQGNDKLDRHFFKDDQYFYKVWSRDYVVKNLIIDGGEFVQHRFRNETSGIAAIDLGLITGATCCALVDVLWDEVGACRGYITKIGIPLTERSQIPTNFLKLICDVSTKSGFAFSDFALKNMVMIDGQCSLIDIDAVPSRISNMDLDFDLQNGALRPHVDADYRIFLLDARYYYANIL